MNTVLTMHAPVLRIVVFKKQDTKIERLQNHMCLAEFESVEHATLALTNLQGQNIYAGCCKMVIQYSSQRDSLQIQRNSEYSHDYTRPDEPGNFILGAQVSCFVLLFFCLVVIDVSFLAAAELCAEPVCCCSAVSDCS